MSTDEQFARRLRFEADDVPAIPLDARRILQAGRRRRQARPMIGAAAGALGIMVAVAGFSALQPTSSAVRPAGSGTLATPSAPAVVDDAATRGARATNGALDAEEALKAARGQLEFRVVMADGGGGLMQLTESHTLAVVTNMCMAAAGFTAVPTTDGTPTGAPLSSSEKVAYDKMYAACVKEYPVYDGATLNLTTP